MQPVKFTTFDNGKIMRSCLPVLAGAMWSLAVVAPAAADPITHFSSTTITSYGSDVDVQDLIGQNPLYFQSDGDVSGGTASSTLSYTSGVADASAQAEASLTAGTLKAKASSTSFEDSVPGSHAFAFARADMGDSFRAHDSNGAFQWTSETEVVFSIDLSGVSSTGGGIGDRADVGFFIAILDPGWLDAYAQWLITGAPLPDDLDDHRATTGYSLGGQVYEFQVPFDVPGTLDFTFAPNGDFDWYAGITVNTAASGTGTSVGDFFSTAAFSYTGPDGATTYSASGLFPGTVPLSELATTVPEPATFVLLGAGLIGLGVARRRARCA